ncbi:MAG: hypothetical protein OHK93_006737 [Ramalina farinacea]|uniref:Uncharacterized protein n=1 Tax=Ramalina farinacea TaxID=258253 RepID=A0AA43QJ57_9LECA|nr:hypothetical protein [Ramalina farinacea]
MTNPHLSDPSLRPFLTPTFSAIDYLNSTLPSLPANPNPTSTTKTQPPSSTTTTNLSSLASQTSSHISTLSAQQSRLTNTLTELTDEILRISSRLAYEVELLRGEAVSLADALSQRGVLSEALAVVMPGGIPPPPSPHPSDPAKSSEVEEDEGATAPNEPPALPRLRTLHRVRAQLQLVIQTFNIALAFPMPPSLLTTTAASIVSITSPDADPDAERKGQVALGKLKGEVVDLLRAGDIGAARRRVQELRGTPMNEKAGKEAATGGGGFLRRLRDEIYLD